MERDDISTESADSLFAAFAERAADEQSRRLAEVRRRIGDCMVHEDAAGLLRAMIAMAPMHRYQMFQRVMHRCDGATSLDGMESILGFIGGYVLDDSYCHAVPYVPSEELQEISRGAIRHNFETDAEREASFKEWMAYQARWFTLVYGEDKDGRRPEARQILDLIRHNEALHAEDESWQAEFLDDEKPPARSI
jgi:hypothetical protein